MCVYFAQLFHTILGNFPDQFHYCWSLLHSLKCCHPVLNEPVLWHLILIGIFCIYFIDCTLVYILYLLYFVQLSVLF